MEREELAYIAGLVDGEELALREGFYLAMRSANAGY